MLCSALTGKNELEKITIPNSLSYIRNRAFIEDCVFHNCFGLERVYLQSCITTLGNLFLKDAQIFILTSFHVVCNLLKIAHSMTFLEPGK